MSPEWYFPANFRTMAHTFLIDVWLLVLETKLCHDLLFAFFMVRLALARIILYFSIFSDVGSTDGFGLWSGYSSSQTSPERNERPLIWILIIVRLSWSNVYIGQLHNRQLTPQERGTCIRTIQTVLDKVKDEMSSPTISISILTDNLLPEIPAANMSAARQLMQNASSWSCRSCTRAWWSRRTSVNFDRGAG